MSPARAGTPFDVGVFGGRARQPRETQDESKNTRTRARSLGARTRLQENVAATRVTLSQAEIEQLDSVIPVGAATGTRYTDMSIVNR